MPKLKTKQRKIAVQFVEYMISGGAYFWSGYLLFGLLYGLHTASLSFNGLGWSLWWSTIVSNVFGWTVNFILQRFWVFSGKGLKGHATAVTSRYAFITLVDFGLNYLILLALRKIGISPFIGQFISAGFFTIWNWIWYKYWVFPEKMSSKERVHTLRLAHRPHGHTAYRRA